MRELTGGRRAAVTQVKVCGITRLEDAELAIDARRVGARVHPLAAVQALRRSRRGRRHRPRDAAQGRDRRRVRQPAAGRDRRAASTSLGLTHVQLHGDEGPSFCSAVAQRTGAKVIKAGADRPRRRPAGPRPLPHRLPPARHGRKAGHYGGTGRTWDWTLLAQRRNKIPLILSRRAERRRTSPRRSRPTRPWGVDVASGVESAPGIKDPEKLEAFFGVTTRRDAARRHPERSRMA